MRSKAFDEVRHDFDNVESVVIDDCGAAGDLRDVWKRTNTLHKGSTHVAAY